MEALGHLIFELFKIAILSAIYSLIILLVLKVVKRSKYSDLVRYKRLKPLKLKIFFSIYILLFVYMFTYWGNHGLGDSAKIPIGHFTTMESVNWDGYARLEDRTYSNGDPIETTAFIVAGNKVLGSCNSDFYTPQFDYFIYDLNTRNLLEFPEAEFIKYTNNNNLPTIQKLKSFNENYQEYWGGWRFWLLP